jgi:predicted metal-binding membrane protein
MGNSSALNSRALLSRDRLFPTSALLMLAALAWVGIILWARSPSMMDAMPGPAAPGRALLFAGMWLVMMAAMMLPAVSPFVLLFRTVQRQRRAGGNLAVPTTAFVSGYLATWLLAGLAGFLIYALVQHLAEPANIGSDVLPYAGGAIVVLAGIYQFTPLKNTCLTHCRSPFHFLLHDWREGRLGALRMGATHGLFCLGCCWGIMAVLFVVGLMNLGWMAALSLLITVEKLAPRGVMIGRAVGLLFIGLGVLIALRPSVVSPAGLTMGSSMNMHHHAMTMPGMSSSSEPMTAHQVYHAVAGPYALTLSIGPAARMLTLAEAKDNHARPGEVMLDGMMNGSMGMSRLPCGRSRLGCQRHVELHVSDHSTGMAMVVSNARVQIQFRRQGRAAQALSVTRMYDARLGIKDLHYGANVSLQKGRYTVPMRVNGRPAVFTVVIR